MMTESDGISQNELRNLSKEEVEAVVQFLLQSSTQDEVDQQGQSARQSLSPACKKCQSTSLEPLHGRYGYYFKCSDCWGNTPMKSVCSSCGSANTKIRKIRAEYFCNCLDCLSSNLYYAAP